MYIYPVVLFDLDGTLLDTIPMILDSFRHVLKVRFDAELSDAELIDGIGTPLITQCEALQQRFLGHVDPALTEDLVQTYLTHNHAIHDERVQAFPQVPEMLDRLAARGARMGIVTSKGHAIAQRGLQLCGLDHHFEVLIGRDDVQKHKPLPDPIWAALEAMGEPAGRALYVGDSHYDLYAGRAAGTATAAALWGPFPRTRLEPAEPNHWLESPAELY